ncbi:hypothetical protein [Streptomyces poriticola]|uniref:hypothetical protein n=1 Tax=Streptomyces poriticola TaxID=3120506 RepID=UPI002FCE316B
MQPLRPAAGPAAGRTPRAGPAPRAVQRDTGKDGNGTGTTAGAAREATAGETAETDGGATEADSTAQERTSAPKRAQDAGLDLDDLARRLIDPVARLLRTELRRGRERTGRPYDRHH